MIYREDAITLDYEAFGLEAPEEPARLTSYLLDRSGGYFSRPKRPAVIVCPGGGYETVYPPEGEPIAMCFSAAGMHAFVLRYSTTPVRFPGALLELSKAVAWVRSHAGEYQIDPNRIVICGFSAGGHLAASLGVYWKEGFVQRLLELDQDENRPNGLVLCYPVISSRKNVTHTGSIANLFGKSPDEEEIRLFSLEEHVSEFTPPTFLWHTSDDNVAPAMNSLLFAQALQEKEIPYELHIFPHGDHGMCLGNEVTAAHLGQISPVVEQWMPLAIRFIQNL